MKAAAAAIILMVLTGASPTQARAPFSVAEGVQLTQLHSDPAWGTEPALKSPTDRRWAFATRQGELRGNLNRYRLYVFEPGQPPREALRMATTSNTSAIGSLRWSADGGP